MNIYQDYCVSEALIYCSFQENYFVNAHSFSYFKCFIFELFDHYYNSADFSLSYALQLDECRWMSLIIIINNLRAQAGNYILPTYSRLQMQPLTDIMHEDLYNWNQNFFLSFYLVFQVYKYRRNSFFSILRGVLHFSINK